MNLSKKDKLKNWFFRNKKKLAYVLSFIIIFVAVAYVVNPTHCGYGVIPRTDTVNDFSFKNGGLYMNVEMNVTIPEADGSIDPNSWTLKKFRIPLTVEDQELPKPEESDQAKRFAFNFLAGGTTGVLLGEMDQSSTPNALNCMENLLSEQNTWLTQMFGLGQVYPTNLSNVVYKEDYPNGTEYVPFASRPLNLDENWHFSQRYQAVVPSPLQFATMVASGSGWVLNNVTNAYTQFINGVNGIRPNYVIENFGVPCSVDNDTSNGIIEMTPSGEGDQLVAEGIASSSISASGDYNSYYVQMWDEEADAFTNPFFLGSYFVSGVVPHIKSTIQQTDGNNPIHTGLEMIDKVSQQAKALESDGEIHSQQEYISLEMGVFGLLLWLTAQINYANGRASGLYEGYDRGYNDAVDDVAQEYTLLLYEQQSELNLSQQQIDTLLDSIDRINTDLKQNKTNPYADIGDFGGIATPYAMPSSVNIIIILTVVIIIGIIIVVIVIIVLLRRRKKKAQAKEKKKTGVTIYQSAGSEPQAPSIKSQVVDGMRSASGKVSSNARRAGSYIKGKVSKK